MGNEKIKELRERGKREIKKARNQVVLDKEEWKKTNNHRTDGEEIIKICKFLEYRKMRRQEKEEIIRYFWANRYEIKYIQLYKIENTEDTQLFEENPYNNKTFIRRGMFLNYKRNGRIKVLYRIDKKKENEKEE